MLRKTLVASLLSIAAPALAADAPASFDVNAAQRYAELALACVQREYPNKIAHVLNGDGDAKPPRELTPAFYGCFDWHSAVHGHWLLARLARAYPDAPFAAKARAALARSLTPERIAAEVAYLQPRGRADFERPYGLAWLLQLAAELREWDDPQAGAWAKTLAPLESAAAAQLKSWIPKLAYPIRAGEHSQTAFAFGLVLDWARATGDAEMARLVEASTRTLYLRDRNCPLAYEPSGQDFLSPCLAEADLVRRVLPPGSFAMWLSAFMPRIPPGGDGGWLKPGIVTDPTDGKLVHLHGLNLSRAWMLEAIAASLPPTDLRLGSLHAAASAHRDAGLRAITGEHYESGHWLGTFAVYLVTERGLHVRTPALPAAKTFVATW